jgi:hypothetical protein
MFWALGIVGFQRQLGLLGTGSHVELDAKESGLAGLDGFWRLAYCTRTSRLDRLDVQGLIALVLDRHGDRDQPWFQFPQFPDRIRNDTAGWFNRRTDGEQNPPNADGPEQKGARKSNGHPPPGERKPHLWEVCDHIMDNSKTDSFANPPRSEKDSADKESSDTPTQGRPGQKSSGSSSRYN